VKCGNRLYRHWSEHEKKSSHCLPSTNISNGEKIKCPNNAENLVVFSLKCELKYLPVSVLPVLLGPLLQSKNLPFARHVHMLDYPVI
jgi:hypothetical protein